jgi:hypothetical protein
VKLTRPDYISEVKPHLTSIFGYFLVRDDATLWWVVEACVGTRQWTRGEREQEHVPIYTQSPSLLIKESRLTFVLPPLFTQNMLGSDPFGFAKELDSVIGHLWRSTDIEDGRKARLVVSNSIG